MVLFGCLLNLRELAEHLGQNFPHGITKNALAKKIRRAHGRAWLDLLGKKIPLVKDGGGKTARYYVKRADLEFLDLPTSVVSTPVTVRRGPGRPPKTDFSE
jgi:hypothetical protein